MPIPKTPSTLLLAIFLVVYGIVTTCGILIPVPILGLLALAAGILILLGK
jgi:hypothetical protein